MDVIIRKQSEQFKTKFQSNNDRIYCDRKWEWGFLRKQCRNLELEPFYNTYTQRLQRSYLSVFIVIQMLVGGTHSVILVAAVNDKTAIFPEIFSYLGAILLVWASLFITFREDIIRRRQWVAYVTSFIAVFILVISDLIIPLYHATVNFPIPPLRPAYGSYILNAIYIFIPLSDNWHSFILGMAVTICYLMTYVMVTYRLDDHYLIKTTTEAIFLLCVNFFGIYFRLMKEIAIRTAFLDRRECVEENLLLRYARDQEKNLLLSIIPAHTADDLERDVRERIEKMKTEQQRKHRAANVDRNAISGNSNPKMWRRPQTDKLFVEEHKDVSVLYADVVNYTYLTTQFQDVKDLVETLHELFVKFDQASEDNNVLRIKFLGDCYYCVSGVPVKNDYHAKSCVRLGLRMIRDIREVRQRRKLNIDMRIGVHSGSILSGVIGACKWQYDIWSKDVDIANRLESTGMPGRVHVSKQTLEQLEGDYKYSEGTPQAKRDEVLQKYGIQTFLIHTPKLYIGDDLHRQSSTGARRLIENNRNSKMQLESSVHKNFMQNTIEQYNQIRIQTKLEMNRELDKMPIGKFHLSKYCLGSQKRLTQDEMEERNFRSNVSTVFLFFKEMRWEFLFLGEADVMLKYSALIGIVTFLGIITIQGINNPRSDLFWIVNGIAICTLFCFLPLTWYRKLWLMLNKPSDDEDDKPTFKISKFFFDVSHKIMRNIWFRVFIYLLIVITLCGSSLLQLVECKKYKNYPDVSTRNMSFPIPITYMKEHRLCFNPWAITESLVLTISMSFLFVRIPFLFKFCVGVCILAIYSWIIFGRYVYIYHQSPSTNLGLDPEYSHLIVVLITLGIFHLMDRQTEYIAKVDYNWKRQLQKKQEDAQFTNETINILVLNILPAHVAEIYMAKTMRNELYYEQYENVAIMFATIKNYDTEKVGLKVLNRIICDFDEILTSHTGPLKIEKIKVAGWTYMAACGLDPGRCESTTSLSGSRRISGQRSSSSVLANGRRSVHSPRGTHLEVDHAKVQNGTTKLRERKQSSRQSHNVVYVLTEFALKLMHALQLFNSENFQSSGDDQIGMLRVGISHGKVTAGVVGSSKPLYDVWGNPVNMASRMDSTGIPGKIQVTEETAEILKSFDIECDFRGETPVKGRGLIPTYFVEVDKNMHFVHKSSLKPENSEETTDL